jgi:Na+/H+ antiporter NhaD/arsenite permease-like protein
MAFFVNLSGNFTLVGASANLVLANLAERSGYRISFGLFVKYSFLITTTSVFISTAYLWLRYL